MIHFRHRAILYKGGKVLGESENKLKTYEDGKFIGSLHAERGVIKIIKNDLRKNRKRRTKNGNYHICVVRIKEDINGRITYKNSKPCMDCLQLMKQYGVDKVSYSNNNGVIITEKVKDVKTTHRSASRKYEHLFNLLRKKTNMKF